MLSKFNKSIPDKCWRCKQSQADMMPIWWSCPQIVPFWNMVKDYILKITSQDLQFHPAQFLLHYQPNSPPRYFKSLPIIMINAAKLCTPRLWGTTKTPSLRAWLTQIDKISLMEYPQQMIPQPDTQKSGKTG